MLDTRYHIVSLVAVFLALGLGILIGTIIVQDPDLLEVQDNLIKQLSDDLKALDAQNSQSRARLAELESAYHKLEAFADEAFPRLVANRLFGRSVAVIGMRSPSVQEESAAVIEALTASGAAIRMVVLEQSLSDMHARLQGLTAIFGDTVSRALDVSATATALAESIVTGFDQSLVERLVSNGFLTIEPSTAIGGVDAVVVVAGPSEHGIAMQPLLDVLLQMNVPVVAASRSAAPAQRQNAGNPGIDVVHELDSVPGRYRLVMELAGEGRGTTSR